MTYSRHFLEMLKEREIQLQWVEQCISSPDRTDYQEDGTVHYLKEIEAFGNRILRVIVNNQVDPPKCITVFFDRRLKK
jgi:hypothetical protein